MDVFQTYQLGTAGYLALQSLPLLFTPRLIVSMLASDGPRQVTDLETYLSRTLALVLLAFAALTLLLSGAVPFTTGIEENVAGADKDGMSKDPYAFPTLVTTVIYHALSAFYIYTNIATAWKGASFALYAGLVCSGALFCLGIWTILFASEKGRVSKKTGADKRTSNFPFVNEESHRQQKRELKEKEKEKEKGREGKRRSVARMGSSRG